jgi:hypothetical protein
VVGETIPSFMTMVFLSFVFGFCFIANFCSSSLLIVVILFSRDMLNMCVLFVFSESSGRKSSLGAPNTETLTEHQFETFIALHTRRAGHTLTLLT